MATFITDAFLLVSLLAFSMQAWAFHRIHVARVRGGVWRTAVCRVGCSILYIAVGLNALAVHWATLQVTFATFCLTQGTWMANAWLDVRDGRRIANLRRPRGCGTWL